MQSYQTEKTVSPKRIITLRGVPFRAGEKVQVIIKSYSRKRSKTSRYPLRGKRIRYTLPFESVAENEWDAAR
jgi:hypothetical protein